MRNSVRYSLITTLVLLAITGSGFWQPALAAGPAGLSASRATVATGERFTVHLSVTETPGLYGAQLSLAYDAARLKVVEVRPGAAWPLANTFVVRSIATAQNVEFAATLYNSTGSVSGDLVAVTFEALPTSATATTSIGPGTSLTFLLADRNGLPLAVAAPAPILISVGPVAAPAPRLSLTSSLPSAAPLAKGDRFSVSLDVTEASALFGAQISLGYDSTRLKVAAFGAGAAWPTGGYFVARNQVTSQTLEFAATLTNRPSGMSGSLVSATFEVIGDAAAGSTAIVIAERLPLLLADRNGMALATSAPAPLTVALAAAPTPTPVPTATPSPTRTPQPTPPPAAACVTATIPLQGGWNLISLPVVPAAGLTAESLLHAINAQGGSAIAVNRWQAGGWQTHVSGLPFNDFAISAARAVFIKTTRGGTLTLCGLPPVAAPMLSLSAGWNLVTIPSGITGLTAESFAQALDPSGAFVGEIAAWSAGSWLSHPRGVPFNDFAVQTGQTFFVRVSEPLTWTP